MTKNLRGVPGLLSTYHAVRNGFERAVPDRVYVEWAYLRRTGQRLDLSRPSGFNEKIQWLKLFDRSPLQTRLADKAGARDYVCERVGAKYLVPLVGLWNDPQEIDFQRLPDSFVLKATHGCGWNILCPDRGQLDVIDALARLKHWHGENYYWSGREWVYRYIRPRVLGEEFMWMPLGESLMDYKFFCFNGEPRFVQVDVDRWTDHRRDFYDMSWQLQGFTVGYPSSQQSLPAPENFDEMIFVAQRLAEPFRFARVDLYSYHGRTRFGEVTFYPGNGMEKFDPPEADRELGGMLRLD